MTWLHWTAIRPNAVPGITKLGCWLLTTDGLSAKGSPQPIRRVEVGLADVSFVMDVKLRDEARRLNRTRNHLWAVGGLLHDIELDTRDFQAIEDYNWRLDDGIRVGNRYVDGADLFLAGIRDSDGRPECFVYRPRWR